MRKQDLTVENKLFGSEFDPINLQQLGITKREYACIHLGIPESGDAELDALIRKAERKKIAAMVLQGIAANYQYNPMNVKHFKKATEDAINQAEALISELEPKKPQEDE